MGRQDPNGFPERASRHPYAVAGPGEGSHRMRCHQYGNLPIPPVVRPTAWEEARSEEVRLYPLAHRDASPMTLLPLGPRDARKSGRPPRVQAPARGVESGGEAGEPPPGKALPIPAQRSAHLAPGRGPVLALMVHVTAKVLCTPRGNGWANGGGWPGGPLDSAPSAGRCRRGSPGPSGDGSEIEGKAQTRPSEGEDTPLGGALGRTGPGLPPGVRKAYWKLLL